MRPSPPLSARSAATRLRLALLALLRAAALLVVGTSVTLGNIGCVQEAGGWAYAREVARRNAILFIGDGMGPAHVQAAGYYVAGAPGSLSFEGLPFQAQVRTAAADNPVTDSAAAATAMATGVKVANGVISQALPGGGADLPSVLERHAARGKATALVTTTTLTHATPAAFGAHAADRGLEAEIAQDYLSESRPDVLLGGASPSLTAATAAAAGYAVATDAAGLHALSASATRLAGLFGNGHLPYEYDGLGALPHLREMTAAALRVLERAPHGFFLMVEGGRIDHAAHGNDIQRNVRETAEFAQAVQVALDWAASRQDTLIVVTADHETGGLQIVAGSAVGQAPQVTWSTTGHTGRHVGAYAWGAGAGAVNGILDNTDLFGILDD